MQIKHFCFILGVFRGEIGVLGYTNMNRCYVCGQTVPPNLVIGAPSTPLCPTTQVVSLYSYIVGYHLLFNYYIVNTVVTILNLD